MEWSGHRSIESVRSYRRTSDERRHALSDILNGDRKTARVDLSGASSNSARDPSTPPPTAPAPHHPRQLIAQRTSLSTAHQLHQVARSLYLSHMWHSTKNTSAHAPKIESGKFAHHGVKQLLRVAVTKLASLP